MRVLRDNGGAVAIEFAICLPVLLTLYIAGFNLADIISCNRKVVIANRTVGDLLSRSVSPSAVASSPTSFDASSIMDAASITLTPYSKTNATLYTALLRVCDSTRAYVIVSKAAKWDSAGAIQSATPLLSGGTLSATSVVTLPSGIITADMVPASPDGSNVCTNFAAGTATKTQIGTAGALIYTTSSVYTYQSLSHLGLGRAVTLSDTSYVLPRQG